MNSTNSENVTKDELVTILKASIAGKSVVIAYLLWFFFGYFGVHRFYLGKIPSGILMLALLVLGSLTTMIGIGFVLLAALGIWWLIDAVWIFLAARKENDKIRKAIDNI